MKVLTVLTVVASSILLTLSPAAGAIIMDDDDPGVVMVGQWTLQPETYGGTQEIWVNDSSHWGFGNAEDSFTWQFTGLDNGDYYVYASWKSVDGSSEAVYSVANGPTVTVDQTTTPDSAVFLDVPFGLLGQVTVTDGTASVTLSSSVAYPYADAIALDAVPEPTSLMLLIGACLAIMAMRRRG